MEKSVGRSLQSCHVYVKEGLPRVFVEATVVEEGQPATQWDDDGVRTALVHAIRVIERRGSVLRESPVVGRNDDFAD